MSLSSLVLTRDTSSCGEEKAGPLHGIYEGDGSAVNVIEAHPTLPLLAVSGIDHEAKASPAFTRSYCLILTPWSSCLVPVEGPTNGRGSIGQTTSSPTTWTVLSFPRFSHFSRTLGSRQHNERWLSGPFSMYAPVKRVKMSLCCIATVVSYLPNHVVSGHASGWRWDANF